jgi:hypothetical protein
MGSSLYGNRLGCIHSKSLVAGGCTVGLLAAVHHGDGHHHTMVTGIIAPRMSVDLPGFKH